MDAVPCEWNGARDQEPFSKTRPMSDTLSRLAKLMARVEHKPDGRSQRAHQPSASVCKECNQEFPDLAGLARHQQREHALRKPHHCHQCGQQFALPSTLQLHKCLSATSVCQVCQGNPQWDAPCTACRAEPQDSQRPEEQPHHYQHRRLHDNGPYACAPCGRAFSHKQELLYHQQAGECQPAPLSPKPLSPPPAPLFPLASVATPTPSHASLPSSPSELGDLATYDCMACARTFRSACGLANHRRFIHPRQPGRPKAVRSREENSQLFPCRSCDKVFSQTSMLYLHRREEHRRETMVRREQKPSAKRTRQRNNGETYPCVHCGKVFLHHLTRWAHFRAYSTHYQTHIRGFRRPSKVPKPGQEPQPDKKHKLAQQPKPPKASKHVKKLKPLERTKKDIRGHRNTKAGKLAIDEDHGSATEDPEKLDEDGEFPCPSCAEIFSTQSALREHEEVHQPTDSTQHCSVCAKSMAPSLLPGPPMGRIYHCVPCRQAFATLEPFLQHCQVHLLCSDEEDVESGQAD